MIDLSKPVPIEVIVASIGVIVLAAGVGLVAVLYFKRKYRKDKK